MKTLYVLQKKSGFDSWDDAAMPNWFETHYECVAELRRRNDSLSGDYQFRIVKRTEEVMG